MPQLQFKYSSDQAHQVNAINAVCDLFRGQEFISAEFTAEHGVYFCLGKILKIAFFCRTVIQFRVYNKPNRKRKYYENKYDSGSKTKLAAFCIRLWLRLFIKFFR